MGGGGEGIEMWFLYMAYANTGKPAKHETFSLLKQRLLRHAY